MILQNLLSYLSLICMQFLARSMATWIIDSIKYSGTYLKYFFFFFTEETLLKIITCLPSSCLRISFLSQMDPVRRRTLWYLEFILWYGHTSHLNNCFSVTEEHLWSHLTCLLPTSADRDSLALLNTTGFCHLSVLQAAMM